MTIGFDAPRKILGKFTIEDVTLWGPKAYMQARGNVLVDRIANGRDVIFNNALHYAPIDPKTGHIDTETILLQRLQSDYMAWRGMKIFS